MKPILTQHQIEYQDFLKSDFWQSLRKECFRRDKWLCRYCGISSSGHLQAHHTLYPDDWYKTTLDHLITLCRQCHKREHGINFTEPKIRRLKKSKKRKGRLLKRFTREDFVTMKRAQAGIYNESDEKRLERARKAVFGKNYARHFLPPEKRISKHERSKIMLHLGIINEETLLAARDKKQITRNEFLKMKALLKAPSKITTVGT